MKRYIALFSLLSGLFVAIAIPTLHAETQTNSSTEPSKINLVERKNSDPLFPPHLLIPQPPLPTKSLTIRGTTLSAEIADTPDTRMIGLMARTELPQGHGMLFVFTEPQPMGFWMHNTLVPLSIAYIDAAGNIREIHDMKPLDETATRSAFKDLVYALEVPQGWFAKNNILPGDHVTGLPSPSTAKPDWPLPPAQ